MPISDKKLILPNLSESLGSIHKDEELIRSQSILFINSNEELQEHLNLIDVSLQTLITLINSYQYDISDEITIKHLGIRLYNDITSVLKLALSGYYHTSIIISRDIFETGMLLSYFEAYPKMISQWESLPDKEREEKFKAVKIREALKMAYHNNKKHRSIGDNLYKSFSNYSHPTPYTKNIIKNYNDFQIKTSFSEKYLVSSIMNLIRLGTAPLSIINYINVLNSLNSSSELILATKENEFLVGQELRFITTYEEWSKKYKDFA